MLIEAPVVPRPARDAVERAKVELARALGDSKVDDSEGALDAHARDESEATGCRPDVVVRATAPEDIGTVLRIASATGVPVTPRAGGTGRTGGAIPLAGGIVLLSSGMNQVKDIDRKNQVAVVEPGLITGKLHEVCEGEGLFYPPDPNSLASCMIGGNVAENAGGPRAFKYGVTRDYVLGIEAYLASGTRIFSGRRTRKGVVGYDVTSLLVGSEGTLAVFSEFTLKLVQKPSELVTILALFDGVSACADAVTAILQRGFVPRCIELMDGATLDAIRGAGKDGAPIDPRAHAMLLLELDDPQGEALLERLANVLLGEARAIDVQVAQDNARRAALWQARRALSPVTKKIAKYKLSEDVVVPRSRMSELLARVAEDCGREGVRHLTYGHAGDGNLHVNFLWNDVSERPAVNRVISKLMHATVELGGTLSGEHGIGITKLEYVPIEQPPALIDLQHRIKQSFDPAGILNPGKMFPAPGTHAHAPC